jgi:pimeloyl-ACP methyl ester carboxylesterase
MATFVLVHGAWNGAHGFAKVRRLLSAAGHEVFTPSLTGLGERSHLSSPQVNLTTHVQDVANHILCEDLHDIVLLGFSYGGFDSRQTASASKPHQPGDTTRSQAATWWR